MRYVFALGVFTVLVAGGQPAYAAKPDCEPFRCAVETAVAARCPCNLGVPAGTVAANHGQYVSCVAHHVRDAVRNGDVATNCKGAVTRCAARSTCGKKSGFVTCARCDAGTCTSGVCDDGVTVCTDSSQCPPVLNHCSTKSTAEACEARGGVAGTGSCCDAVCVASPSGAFVD